MRMTRPLIWQTPVISIGPAKKILGFWHIGAMGDYARIVAEQYRALIDSGLHAASEKIIVGFIGGRNLELPTFILEDPKFEVFATGDLRDYEYPTLVRLWHEAQRRQDHFLCYYFHTKGASLSQTERQGAANAWRLYMEYFNIEKWKDCVNILNGYETSGVELQDAQSHYSGNFWWATSEYIRKLPNADEFWARNRMDRAAAEYYLCIAKPKAYCFNDFLENLYDFEMPPERYRK